MPYKVKMQYPDGTTEEEDEVFETREEADAYGLIQCSDYKAGGEVLHLSNPGDYPPPDEVGSAHFEIIEVS
jgi:hypothetical protein